MDKDFSGIDYNEWRLWEGEGNLYNKNDVLKFPEPADFGPSTDMVDSPAHYTRGKQEAIDIIEDAIADAPSNKQGFLQAQVLKYMLRLWLKSNSREDAEKARWYLNRLIDSL